MNLSAVLLLLPILTSASGDLRRTAPTVRRVSTVTFSDCSLGKMVMDVIREFMGEKPSKAAIENALYNSFEALLGPNQRMSNDFASASSIADVILASRSGPDDICVLNVVCSEISHYFDTDKAKRRMQQPALVGVPSRDCSLGKLIMPRVEELMANAPTKEAIKNTLYSIYDALPISHARSSEDFVVRFGKPLTDLVVNRMSGDSDICPVHLACDELYEMDKEYKD